MPGVVYNFEAGEEPVLNDVVRPYELKASVLCHDEEKFGRLVLVFCPPEDIPIQVFEVEVPAEEILEDPKKRFGEYIGHLKPANHVANVFPGRQYVSEIGQQRANSFGLIVKYAFAVSLG